MTVQLECKECNGDGVTTDYTGACRDQSNECCGGCSLDTTCDICKGDGVVDVDLFEEYDNELAPIVVHITNMYKDMTNRGVSVSETKELIGKVVSKLIEG